MSLSVKDIFAIMTADEKRAMGLLLSKWPGFRQILEASNIELNDEEKSQLLRRPHSKIQVIKALRERLDCGLRAAKDACDMYLDLNGEE